MAPDVSSTLAAQHRAAVRKLRAGQLGPALGSLASLFAEVAAPAAAYDSWVKTLLEAGRALGASELKFADAEARERAISQLARLQVAAHLYLGTPADLQSAEKLLSAPRLLSARLLPVERARFLRSAGAAASTADLAATGEILAERGHLVAAAAAYLAAGRRDAAIRCYQTLLAMPVGTATTSVGSRPPWTAYEQALAHFQLAVLLTQAESSREVVKRHAVAAQSLLEQLADEYEAANLPERAIDVYCVYIALGRATARFENIAEGFVGCLRLLKGERLITAALRCYEDFLTCCGEWGEYLLAGQQAKDAAEFLDQCGLPWGDGYRRRAAAFFLRAGEDERREPAYRESLLLQAVSLYSALSDPSAVRRTLLRVAELVASSPATAATPAPPQSPSERAARYRQLADLHPAPAAIGEGSAESPRGAVDAAASEAVPPGLADRSGELPVWDLDLCEWEDAGRPDLVAFAILCDRGRPQLSRRQALRVLLLHDLAPPLPAGLDAIQARLQLVDALAGLHCYEALRPLEELLHAARPLGPAALSANSVDDAWRSAVLRWPQIHAAAPEQFVDHPLAPLRRQLIEGLPRLPFRRALSMIVRGLADPDLGVFAASLQALSQGRYIGSVSLLSRLLDGSEPSLLGVPLISRLDVQRAALVALSRVRELRAYQLILDVYRREAEPLRSDAFRLLRYALESDSNTVRPLLLRAAQQGERELGRLGIFVGD